MSGLRHSFHQMDFEDELFDDLEEELGQEGDSWFPSDRRGASSGVCAEYALDGGRFVGNDGRGSKDSEFDGGGCGDSGDGRGGYGGDECSEGGHGNEGQDDNGDSKDGTVCGWSDGWCGTLAAPQHGAPSPTLFDDLDLEQEVAAESLTQRARGATPAQSAEPASFHPDLQSFGRTADVPDQALRLGHAAESLPLEPPEESSDVRCPGKRRNSSAAESPHRYPDSPQVGRADQAVNSPPPSLPSHPLRPPAPVLSMFQSDSDPISSPAVRGISPRPWAPLPSRTSPQPLPAEDDDGAVLRQLMRMHQGMQSNAVPPTHAPAPSPATPSTLALQILGGSPPFLPEHTPCSPGTGPEEGADIDLSQQPSDHQSRVQGPRA